MHLTYREPCCNDRADAASGSGSPLRAQPNAVFLGRLVAGVDRRNKGLIAKNASKAAQKARRPGLRVGGRVGVLGDGERPPLLPLLLLLPFL